MQYYIREYGNISVVLGEIELLPNQVAAYDMNASFIKPQIISRGKRGEESKAEALVDIAWLTLGSQQR